MSLALQSVSEAGYGRWFNYGVTSMQMATRTGAWHLLTCLANLYWTFWFSLCTCAIHICGWSSLQLSWKVGDVLALQTILFFYFENKLSYHMQTAWFWHFKGVKHLAPGRVMFLDCWYLKLVIYCRIWGKCQLKMCQIDTWWSHYSIWLFYILVVSQFQSNYANNASYSYM